MVLSSRYHKQKPVSFAADLNLLLQPNAHKKNDPPSYVHLNFHNTALLLALAYVYTTYAQPIAAQCCENPSEHSLEGRSSYTRLVVVELQRGPKELKKYILLIYKIRAVV